MRMLTLAGAIALSTILNLQPGLAIAQSDRPPAQCPAFIPRVNPWKLEKPILLGCNFKSADFYKHVVLAGNAQMVSAFLDCYDLHTRQNPNYASGLYRLWASCKELVNPSNPKGTQMVCVAMNDSAEALDNRIFNEDYARKVALKIFRS